MDESVVDLSVFCELVVAGASGVVVDFADKLVSGLESLESDSDVDDIVELGLKKVVVSITRVVDTESCSALFVFVVMLGNVVDKVSGTNVDKEFGDVDICT